jgi:hypothetical protein
MPDHPSLLQIYAWQEYDAAPDFPVLFDFRRSFDPDGDDFTVSVYSDLMADPILEGKDTAYWYNDYLPAGEHTLTFELIDSNGMQRTVHPTW